MAELGESALMMGAPEVGIPMEIGKQLAPHAPMVMMMPLVFVSIILIIVGIVVFSTAKAKAPGTMLLVLGFLLGGGTFFMMAKTENKKKT